MKNWNSNLTAGLSILTVFALLAMGPVIMASAHLSQPPLTDLHITNIAPFTQGDHILGTDAMGRDLFSMLAWGALGSLSVALVASFTSVFVGNLFGSVSALMGG